MAYEDTLKNRDWLYDHYVVQELSTVEIAVLSGVPNGGPAQVRRWLIKHDIPRRSISEAKKGKARPSTVQAQIDGEKACSRCGIVKPLVAFHIAGGNLGGRTAHCKKCAGLDSSKAVRDMRLKVVEALGGKCQCDWKSCDITEMVYLAIDHRHGGGYKDRMSSSGSYSYYKSMLTHLQDFQLLCHNHNFEKRILLKEHRLI